MISKKSIKSLFIGLLSVGTLISFGGQAAAPSATSSKPVIQIELGGHAAPVRRISVDPARNIVVTASDDKSARVWNLKTGDLTQILRPAVGDGHIGRLYGAALHPNQDMVAVAGTTAAAGGRHKILLFEPSTGRLLESFDARGGDIKRLVWTPDGQLLLAVYAGDSALRAFDQQGELVFEQRFKALSYGLDVSVDGMIAASVMNGQVHLFEYANRAITGKGSLRTSGRRPIGVAFSPDGQQLAVGFFNTKNKVFPPEIFDIRNRRSTRTMAERSFRSGNLWSVSWSSNGRRLFAAGTALIGHKSHPIFEYEVSSGRILGKHVVASNSVTDLTQAYDGQIWFASFDGSWGALNTQTGETRSASGKPADMRGPERLKISADSRRVAFFFDDGKSPAWFDLDRRLVTLGASPEDMRPPRVKRGLFGGSAEWRNTQTPSINGQRIAMASDEVARSLAYFNQGEHALFGSNRHLFRIDGDGAISWKITTTGEVWAINVSADDQFAVTTMSNGTISWWNTSDGSLLMTLLVRRDGQWVIWTPAGQFDAGAGADRIVGWAVNRADSPTADFFSLNRFRKQFNRPAIIDGILGISPQAVIAPVQLPGAVRKPAGAVTLTVPDKPGKASTPAVVAQPATPTAPAPIPVAPAIPALPSTAKAPVTPVVAKIIKPLASISATKFPPVLTAVDLNSLKRSSGKVRIPFTVRSEGKVEVVARVDGRPVENVSITLPTVLDGKTRGIATMPSPATGSVIQLIARDQFGVSEPLGFKLPTTTASAPVVSVPAVVAPIQVVSTQPTVTFPPPKVSPVLVGPRLFVLSIGISNYQRAQYQLGLADKDSRDFVAAVAAQKGRYYGDVHTRSITNEQATRANIMSGLKWLSDNVGPADIGMLFMAGHGINAPDGQYFFIPWEGQHERLAQTSVPENAIRQTLGSMRGKALFFVDTCYAGNALGNFQTASRELARLANNLAASENGVIVFASSSGRQLSEENDAWGNGAFTKALIEGLSGKADFRKTGRITYKGLDFFISEEVSRLTQGRQTPVTISPIGIPDFAIANADKNRAHLQNVGSPVALSNLSRDRMLSRLKTWRFHV